MSELRNLPAPKCQLTVFIRDTGRRNMLFFFVLPQDNKQKGPECHLPKAPLPRLHT